MSQKVELIRRKAKGDYFYFAKEIIGFSKMQEDPHREVCNHITKIGKRKKLTLMPRNSFKSSVITVAGTLYFLQQNPNERILIASETQKNATKYVKEIKGHIESNQKFRALFGDWVNKNDTWRDFEFTINKRTKVFKECSVTASSLEKGLQTGMHYSKIFLDDVVSRANINSPEQIQKTLDYYRLLLSILDPDGVIFINGTRWHYLDLYGWIQDPKNREYEQFDVLVKSAYREDGSLLMPEVLNEKFLEEQKITQGDYVFSCQYLNSPIGSETQTFKKEWVQFYDKSPGGLIYFMTIDPAITTKMESDSTGVIVNGVDWKHNYFLQEALALKLDLPDLIRVIFDMNEKYPLMCLGMQKFALEKALKLMLDEEMQRRKVWIPIKVISTDNRVSKEARIKGLQPKFENKQIFLKPEHTELYSQIVMYPQVKHDDILDALKDQTQITFPSDVITDVVGDKFAHLTPMEKKIWANVAKYDKRRVVRKKMDYL